MMMIITVSQKIKPEEGLVIEEAGFVVREKDQSSLYSVLGPPLADTSATDGLPLVSQEPV